MNRFLLEYFSLIGGKLDNEADAKQISFQTLRPPFGDWSLTSM